MREVPSTTSGLLYAVHLSSLFSGVCSRNPPKPSGGFLGLCLP